MITFLCDLVIRTKYLCRPGHMTTFLVMITLRLLIFCVSIVVMGFQGITIKNPFEGGNSHFLSTETRFNDISN